ncbi:MAG TPA: hypothetical protein VMZ27_18225, partial [Candidatus Saccharimonadales bacterium]|nr:hypothetical protein [Candidatus Saccharimonadales bacterium]
VNGSDVTGQRGRLQFAFQTLTAAKTAALSGDTIMVLPGTYNEKNLAKNGVNWHFFSGAKIDYVGLLGVGIFDTNAAGGACTFTVSGFGIFKVTSEPGPLPLIKSGYAADNIKVECDRIDANGSALDAVGTVLLRCNEMKSVSATCIATFTTANVQVFANKISSSGGHAIETSGGTLDVVARWISSSAGKGIRVNAGILYVTAHEISSSTDYALEYTNSYSALCRIQGARLVSTAPSGGGKAVYVSNGTGNLRLVNCALVGTAPATLSIDALAATTVLLYGECVANLAKGANVTTLGSGLTVNANLT